MKGRRHVHPAEFLLSNEFVKPTCVPPFITPMRTESRVSDAIRRREKRERTDESADADIQ